MRSAVLALLALGLPLSAAPAPKEKKDKPVLYYATKVGDKLVYDVTSGVGGKNSERTMTVTEVEEKDGVYTVTMKQGENGGSGEKARVTADSLTMLQDGAAFNSPVILFKLPAKKGDSWVSPPDGKAAVAITFKSTFGGEEEVEVPAGKFKAIRLDLTVSAGGPDVILTIWIAPGIGPVKMTSATPGLAQTLKSFTPAK